MHIETVTLDRVFDIQQREGTRYAPRRTDFSFESGGKKHYAVQAPGWPRIAQGDTLTVVLGKAGNWQTLAGWKNHATGELVLPHSGRSLFGILQALLMTAVAAVLWARAATPGGRALCICLAGFSALFFLQILVQWRRQKAQARAIRQADVPPI